MIMPMIELSKVCKEITYTKEGLLMFGEHRIEGAKFAGPEKIGTLYIVRNKGRLVTCLDLINSTIWLGTIDEHNGTFLQAAIYDTWAEVLQALNKALGYEWQIYEEDCLTPEEQAEYDRQADELFNDLSIDY
jgi:hypothetical protein